MKMMMTMREIVRNYFVEIQVLWQLESRSGLYEFLEQVGYWRYKEVLHWQTLIHSGLKIVKYMHIRLSSTMWSKQSLKGVATIVLH